RAEVTDPLGQTNVIEYDTMRRPIAVTGPTGQVVHLAYDAAGRIKSVQNPALGTTTFDWKDDTQLLSSTTGPSDERRSFAYDAHGNLTLASKASEGCGATAFEYYPDGLVSSMSSCGGQRRSFTYDTNGRLAAIEDAARNKIFLEYDEHGQL